MRTNHDALKLLRTVETIQTRSESTHKSDDNKFSETPPALGAGVESGAEDFRGLNTSPIGVSPEDRAGLNRIGIRDDVIDAYAAALSPNLIGNKQPNVWVGLTNGNETTPIARVVIFQGIVSALAWAQLHPTLRVGTLLVSMANPPDSDKNYPFLLDLLTRRYPGTLVGDCLDRSPAGEAGSEWLGALTGSARFCDYKPMTEANNWEAELERRRNVAYAVPVATSSQITVEEVEISSEVHL